MQLLKSEVSSTAMLEGAFWDQDATAPFSSSKGYFRRAPFLLALTVLPPLSTAAVAQDFPTAISITSYGEFRSIDALKVRHQTARLPRSASARLARIRANLSLQVAELSRILHVERPTIYSWMRDDGVALRSDNRERLERLEGLAHRWQRISNLPVGPRIRRTNETGESVVSLLEQDRVVAAEELLLALAAGPEHPPARRVPSVREVLAQRGLETTKGSRRDKDNPNAR